MFTPEQRWAIARAKSRKRWRENAKCAACGSGGPIHLHHTTYSRVKREISGDLVPVCIPCHLAIHAEHQRDKSRVLWNVTHEFIRRARLNRGVYPQGYRPWRPKQTGEWREDQQAELRRRRGGG